MDSDRKSPVRLRQIVATVRNGVEHLIGLSWDGSQLFERFTDGDVEDWHPFNGPMVELQRKRNVAKQRRRSRNRR